MPQSSLMEAGSLNNQRPGSQSDNCVGSKDSAASTQHRSMMMTHRYISAAALGLLLGLALAIARAWAGV